MRDSHNLDRSVNNKDNKANPPFPLHFAVGRLLKIKRLALWGLTLSYSTGCLHFYHLLKCFVMRKTKAWICTAVTRLFRTSQKCKNASLMSLFFVRNKIVKDKKRHEDDIPCLFCLCCLESNPDYSKKLCCESWRGSCDNHCLVSPYWMVIKALWFS